MADEHVQKHRPRRGDDHTAEDGQATVSERKAEMDAEVDALLDDIDGVLEQNAAEFVASFVQKGGQ